MSEIVPIKKSSALERVNLVEEDLQTDALHIVMDSLIESLVLQREIRERQQEQNYLLDVIDKRLNRSIELLHYVSDEVGEVHIQSTRTCLNALIHQHSERTGVDRRYLFNNLYYQFKIHYFIDVIEGAKKARMRTYNYIEDMGLEDKLYNLAQSLYSSRY